MSGFGIDPFSQFADEGDATEDPFGIAASAREMQWWTPYGSVVPRRKKRSGLDAWNQEGPPPSSVAPPTMAPSPSTTQRVILDQKQGDESIARLLGGGAPRDTGAGGDDAFSRDNQTFLAQRYQAPDPTNPGQQDQARSATVDNAAMDEWRESMKKAKELEDQALALPPRTGFGGIYDDKRNRLYEGARVLRQRAAYAAASVPGASELPPEWHPVGGNSLSIFNKNARQPQFATSPEAANGLTARTGRGGAAARTPAPQKPIEVLDPDTGKPVMVDPTRARFNPETGVMEKRTVTYNPKLVGPLAPGEEPMSDVVDKPYGAQKPGAVQAVEARAKVDAEGGDEDGADDETEPDPVKVQAAHNNIDARFDRRLDQARDPKARAQIEADRKKAHDEADARLAPKSKKGAAGGGGGGYSVLDTAPGGVKPDGRSKDGKTLTGIKNGKRVYWKA